MECTVKRLDLQYAAHHARGVISRHGSKMPILANVLLCASDGKVTASGTDLALSAVATIPGSISAPGAACVDAARLLDLVKSLPGETVGLRRTPKQLELQSGRSTYRLVTMDEKDFPKIAAADQGSHRVDAKLLERLLGAVFHACEENAHQQAMGSIRFEVQMEATTGSSDGAAATVARVVATNGHRLTVCALRIAGAPTTGGPILIPRDGAAAMLKALAESSIADLAIGLNKRHLFLGTTGRVGCDLVLGIKLSDATFPDLTNALKPCTPSGVKLPTSELREALERGRIIVAHSQGLRLTLGEGLRIDVENPDMGTSTELLDAPTSGPDTAVGLNVRYLLDVLNHTDAEHTSIELNQELDPVVVRPHVTDPADLEHFGVIMPMRLS